MNICKMLCYLMFSRWMFISEFSAWVSAIFNLIKVFIFKAIFGFVKSDRIWFYQITLSAVNDQFDLELTCEAARRFVSDKFPPFATLFPHSPDLSNKCSPFPVIFQSYFIFLQIHLKLLEVAADDPELLLQLRDLLLLRRGSLHSSRIFRFEICKPWRNYYNAKVSPLTRKDVYKWCKTLVNLRV